MFYFGQKFEGLLRINQDFNNLWVYADSAAHPLQVKIILQFPPLCPKTAVKTNYKTIYIENIIVPIFFFFQKIALWKHWTIPTGKRTKAWLSCEGRDRMNTEDETKKSRQQLVLNLLNAKAVTAEELARLIEWGSERERETDRGEERESERRPPSVWPANFSLLAEGLASRGREALIVVWWSKPTEKRRKKQNNVTQFKSPVVRGTFVWARRKKNSKPREQQSTSWVSGGDLAGLSGKHVRSATLIGRETKDDKRAGSRMGAGGSKMGGVPARGWNFWESAPVNTRGCAAL